MDHHFVLILVHGTELEVHWCADQSKEQIIELLQAAQVKVQSTPNPPAIGGQKGNGDGRKALRKVPNRPR